METKNFAFTVKVIPGLELIRQNGLMAKVGLIAPWLIGLRSENIFRIKPLLLAFFVLM